MPFAAFLVFFAGLWTAISFFIAWQSGWSELARRCRGAAEPPPGERRRWASASLDGVAFRSCLNFVAGETGLYVRPTVPFRLFLPPLLIPWSDIRFLALTSTLGIRRASFRLGASEGPTLTVGRGVAGLIGPRLAEPQRALYEDAARAAPPPSRRKLAAVGLAVGLIASGAFYVLAGREPDAPPLPIFLFPAVLILAAFLLQDR